ncbi:trichoplein keratin filament-binding protein-like [Melitaea cinxia]|uniref:trichoplein keratin filament-binding protein-like n=1 Tax=Melitaea cinxia TaxID=113334 RepID=UPI001E26F781|nr:trichoplein keratin filament-binding protein-like [Melitaea cinxia]
MVLCYKIITDSPKRSRSVSPRKSPIGRNKNTIFLNHNLIIELISSIDYETNKGDVWDSIPERDWKLLAALAKKRDEQEEREKLAEQFQKMWLKEKEEREMAEAETSEQYKRYLHQKRTEEKYHNEYRRLQRMAEQQFKTGQLLSCIQYKERRSADLLAWRDDQKVSEIIGKAMEEQTRAHLAAERRYRRMNADEWKHQVELVYTLKKSDDASKRRNALLRDVSQRRAITNALSSWETSLIRQEVAAMEAARRAHIIAHCALKDAKNVRLTRARENKLRRARKLAALTAQMREAVRSGR